MTFLYNCRSDGDQFRITKFDHNLNVESSYLCTEHECECPAGHRPRCRHREMLPLFIRRKAVGSGWWLDYDRGGWVQMADDPEPAIAEAVGEPEYGIGPMMITDLPLVHADNERKRKENIEREKELMLLQPALKSWRRF